MSVCDYSCSCGHKLQKAETLEEAQKLSRDYILSDCSDLAVYYCPQCYKENNQYFELNFVDKIIIVHDRGLAENLRIEMFNEDRKRVDQFIIDHCSSCESFSKDGKVCTKINVSLDFTSSQFDWKVYWDFIVLNQCLQED